VPLATYKDLCIDAVDARRLGEFWAGVLDLELEPLEDGDVRLTGPTPQHTIWVNTVPEAPTVKQRVHLDVNARSADDVVALGATPLDLDSFKWKVLRDPEGGELCVFERDDGDVDRRLYEVVVDCHDAPSQATWWAEVLQAKVGHHDQGEYSWVEEIPFAPFRYLVFVPVPEDKTVKNRIHIDLEAGDIPDIVSRGATRLREPDDEIRWTVMADPEGNEFCAFEPRRMNDDVDPLPPEADFPG
jgi:hypothetical protein